MFFGNFLEFLRIVVFGLFWGVEKSRGEMIFFVNFLN